MTLGQAITIAVVQGATELFPVSSLGHAVLLPWLLGWNMDAQGATFLPFLVMLHVGTGCALLIYFRQDWLHLLPHAGGKRSAADKIIARRLATQIGVATIPAVAAGGLFEHHLRLLFGSPLYAAGFLIANGLMLVTGEKLQRRMVVHTSGSSLHSLTFRDAFVIGCWQCLALLPGLSRSGATMVGGLLRGVSHEAAAHFSFLIAFPVILAATAFEVPRLLRSSPSGDVMRMALLSSVVAGLVAYASTAFLMRYLANGNRAGFIPFAVYCVTAGVFALMYGAYYAT